MNIFDFILIGITQGILEWIPVSSQGGVMVLLLNFIKINSELAFNYSIFLHLGTVIAATIYFRAELSEIFSFNNIKNLFNSKGNDFEETKFLKFIIISTFFTFLVSGLIYLFLKDNIAKVNVSLITVIIGCFLIITGLLSLIKSKTNNASVSESYSLNQKFTNKNATILGLMQGFCIIPGISRSGITSSTMLLQKFNAKDAFRTSFIISIPVILIGEIGLLILNGTSFISFDYRILISVAAAAIIGYLTIGLVLKFVQKFNFAIICFILAAIYIFFSLF
ncbi:MAG: undecaprenyl-diphosphate phosphatase [archaeon]